MPSARHSKFGLAPRISNGRTATEGLSGSGRGVPRPLGGGVAAEFLSVSGAHEAELLDGIGSAMNQMTAAMTIADVAAVAHRHRRARSGRAVSGRPTRFPLVLTLWT